MANHSTIHARLVPPKSKTTGKRNVSSGNQLIDLEHDGLYLIKAIGRQALARCLRIEGIKPDLWVIPSSGDLATDTVQALKALAGGAE